MPLELNKIHRGPISDPNSVLAAIDVPCSPSVIKKLRAHKIRFSISINPMPEEDEAECDVFWFYPDDDIENIQRLIYQAQAEVVA